MTAVLVRRGIKLCSFHSELCRVVWHPQAALFSSNQSDRKQPRRTHIRKAKPQPAVDVSTLLEQIFSHRRPGSAPPTRKSQTVQSTSISAKPPPTSSVRVSTSNVPPLLKTAPAISAFPPIPSHKQGDGVVSVEHPPPQPKSTSHANLETSQDHLASLESETPAVETVENKAGTETLDVPVLSKLGFTIDQTLVTSSCHASTVEPSTVEPVIKATVDSQVDASPATVETLTIEDPVYPAEDAAVQSKSTHFPDPSQDPLASLESEAPAVETVETEGGAETLDFPVLSKPAHTIDRSIETSSFHASTLEPVIKIPSELQVDTSPVTEATVFTAPTAEDPVDPTEDATVQSKSIHFPDTLQDPLASFDSEVPAVEAIETKVDAETLNVPVLSQSGQTVDQTLETSSFCASAVEPVIKAALESQVEARPASVESIVTPAAIVEEPVDPTEDATVHSKSFDLEVRGDLTPSKELPTLEATIDSESRIGGIVEAEAVEAEAVAQVVQTNSADSVQAEVLDVTKEESPLETMNSFTETGTSSLETGAAVVEGPTTKTISATAAENSTNAQESAAAPFENGSIIETSSGNVTVEEGRSEIEGISIESVMMESLKIDELLQTQHVLDEEDEKEFQSMLDQTESGTELQTKTEKSPEPESENFTEILSKWDSLTEDLQDMEGETRMLEKQFLYHNPVRVSRVETGSVSDPPGEEVLQMDDEAAEAESMTLESLILAEVKAEVGRLETAELRETRTALEKDEELVAKEATTDADLAFEYLLDASDILKADASHILEAVILSEQRPEQVSSVVDKKLGPRDEAFIQEVVEESPGEERRILDGITNEVAETDVLLPTLETMCLSKTIDCLEKAADVLAKEKKMEVEDAAALEGMIGALEVDSLSEADVEALPDALQSDVLMEELLCFASGSVAKDPASGIAATWSASVHKEAAVTDGVPDPSALGEIVPEVEEVKEEAVQTEAPDDQRDLDPVQRLFLEKIKEYNKHSGEVAVKEPDYERRLSEETAKLQRLYGGGDLNSFPQFTFTEPKMDQDAK